MRMKSGMVAHTFNSSTWEAEAGRTQEFESSLFYRESSWIARVILKNYLKKHQKRKEKKP